MVLKVGLDPITLKAQLLLKWLAEVVIITELRKGEGGGARLLNVQPQA